jgi:hypothetical protein
MAKGFFMQGSVCSLYDDESEIAGKKTRRASVAFERIHHFAIKPKRKHGECNGRGRCKGTMPSGDNARFT